MSSRWPFMATPAATAAESAPCAPGVLCAACERAEAPRPLLTPLCDDCGERLAGFGLPVGAQPAPDTPTP